MATQVTLGSGVVDSAAGLKLRTNGSTEAVDISTGQVVTLAQNPVLTLGTTNGVAYLNGSKVLTTGSALTFDGTNLGLGASATSAGSGIPTFQLTGTSGTYPLRSGATAFITQDGTSGQHYDYFDTGVMWHQTVTNTPQAWKINNAEQMRLTSTGLGIGTSSPNASAILDAQSTTKGVRFPNMTTTQKNAISSPAAGLVVFDTTLAKLCVYSGSAWQTITSV